MLSAAGHYVLNCTLRGKSLVSRAFDVSDRVPSAAHTLVTVDPVRQQA
jgi:hypothetical protein